MLALQPVHPPGNVCFRGGGFDDRYRSFYAAGRQFRQPAYLATSFSRTVADGFPGCSAQPTKVLWLVCIDPQRKCVHVNLAGAVVVMGLAAESGLPCMVFAIVVDNKARLSSKSLIISLRLYRSLHCQRRWLPWLSRAGRASSVVLDLDRIVVPLEQRSSVVLGRRLDLDHLDLRRVRAAIMAAMA